jgi:mannose-1-phosphate guanylyltransferase
MNQANNYVVIMAGGIGTRFWPFSRTYNPKQFHDVLGTGKTLLQQTAERFEGICPHENIFIVTHQDYRDITLQQLPFLKPEQVLLEPMRRNTAPCLAYACYKIATRNPHACIVATPADHIILKEKAFQESIKTALETAVQQPYLITLGIKPNRPDTGYGYIQFQTEDRHKVKKVKTFAEKPSLEWAQKFLESGDFVWNAGIFIWNAQTFSESLQKYQPEMAEIFAEGSPHYFSPSEPDFIEKAYSQCKSESIDKGIMEKALNVYVILSDVGWSDLGTWKSLYEVSEKDASQNVIDGNVLLYDTKGCIIKTPSQRLVAINGLEDFIVAEYDNVLLICRREDEQKVKDLVADAKNKGNEYI